MYLAQVSKASTPLGKSGLVNSTKGVKHGREINTSTLHVPGMQGEYPTITIQAKEVDNGLEFCKLSLVGGCNHNTMNVNKVRELALASWRPKGTVNGNLKLASRALALYAIVNTNVINVPPNEEVMTQPQAPGDNIVTNMYENSPPRVIEDQLVTTNQFSVLIDNNSSCAIESFITETWADLVEKEQDPPPISVPPKPHVIKLNTDGASFGNPGPSSIGVTYRDNEGAFKLVLSRNFGICTSFQAKCNAIMMGAELDLAKGWNHIWIESDSTSAIGVFSTRNVFWQLKARWNNCVHNFQSLNLEGSKFVSGFGSKKWRESFGQSKHDI
ncbi:hypothetical protein IFM89_035222 [Coptis chinensis]|uniref:RNase H type-1 domain-containing protein n=1 Tax=Coptis chinensis TaxID=261450 RepID=A0A835IKF3_9MAGN|nr:hypothetical protein IFM89_035222 [Coptis chinensis]